MAGLERRGEERAGGSDGYECMREYFMVQSSSAIDYPA